MLCAKKRKRQNTGGDKFYDSKMDTLSCLWQQNKVADTGRYKVKEFSPLLSEM